MQNKVRYGTSLVSKSLPIKKQFFVSRLFSMGKNLGNVLRSGKRYACGCRLCGSIRSACAGSRSATGGGIPVLRSIRTVPSAGRGHWRSDSGEVPNGWNGRPPFLDKCNPFLGEINVPVAQKFYIAPAQTAHA